MSRKFEDEVTVIRIFTPDQTKMVEALNYIIDIQQSNENAEATA